MAAPDRLQIINPSYSGGDGADVFRLFPALSTELRLRIWQCSIEQHRLIEIDVAPPWASEDAPLYSTTNTLDRLISGRKYIATVQGRHLYSKLLRVNSESRQVALKFYRVHIPCYFQTTGGDKADSTKKSILYFSPEYDFMFLRANHPPEHTFVDFLHDLKAYDPKDIGLLNWAQDSNSMRALDCLQNISEAPARATFVDFLRRVQEIIWVSESACGRAIIGPLQDFQDVGVRFNHSMPIKAITPTFRLTQDPRAIKPDLRYILTACTDPRHMRVLWRQLLAKWEIKQAQQTKERVLFAYKAPTHDEQIHDIKTVNNFLREEEEKWLEVQQKWSRIVMKHAGKVPVEGPEELAKAVRPAVGFWLFPAEALGSLEGVIWESKKVFDMTGYSPELALSSLF